MSQLENISNISSSYDPKNYGKKITSKMRLKAFFNQTLHPMANSTLPIFVSDRYKLDKNINGIKCARQHKRRLQHSSEDSLL